jgi:hypothetical protein
MSIWAYRAIETADCFQCHARESADDRAADMETVRVMSPEALPLDSQLPPTLPFASDEEGGAGPTYDGRSL